jgi:hypothetical protein
VPTAYWFSGAECCPGLHQPRKLPSRHGSAVSAILVGLELFGLAEQNFDGECRWEYMEKRLTLARGFDTPALTNSCRRRSLCDECQWNYMDLDPEDPGSNPGSSPARVGAVAQR